MKKTWQKIAASVLIVILAALAIYFLVFTKVALVSDASFDLNMKNYSFIELRFELAKKGARLSVVKTDSDDLTGSESVKALVQSLSDKDVVLFSPVMTAVCDSLDIDVSSSLENTVSAGISYSNKGNFDIVLKSEDIELEDGEIDYRMSLSDDSASVVAMPDLKEAFYYLLTLDKANITTDTGTLYYEKRNIR